MNGDKGYAGREFEGELTELGITSVRPGRRDESRRQVDLALIHGRVESIFDTAIGQLALETAWRPNTRRRSPLVGSACSPWPPPSGTT